MKTNVMLPPLVDAAAAQSGVNAQGYGVQLGGTAADTIMDSRRLPDALESRRWRYGASTSGSANQDTWRAAA
jgi:hypothetical protein